ncbi:hypothetical protein WMY93_031861 [Mugilogobius chulae]|uniref:Bcl-2-like protein 15 n=1 Tax=Mugilogobius chulae TaxID=88201 RepID=A0AAW0MGP2_9GOBI
MAPNLPLVEQQTFELLGCLFKDDSVNSPQFLLGGLHSDDIETDSPGDDTFDAARIADQLRQVADALNKDPRFQEKLTEFKKAAAHEALEQALSSGVDALVQTQVGHKAEVSPELQLIKASVALGLYMKKTCPDVRGQLQSAIGNFLNQRVGQWVTQQGGWGRVASQSQL